MTYNGPPRSPRGKTARLDTGRSSSGYEIWWTTGGGTQRGPRFRLLQDALHWIEQRSGIASFAIRTPDGSWHRWPGSGRAIRDRADGE